MLSQEADLIDGVTFVWFTDGTAWRSARRNLEETFNVMDNIYNIDDMEHDIMDILFLGEQDFLMVAEKGEEYKYE